MRVTMQKLVLGLAVVGLAVGGGWLWLRSRVDPHPVPVTAAAAPDYQVVPIVRLPPFQVVTGSSSNPEQGVASGGRWSNPDDETAMAAAMGAVVPPAISERLGLHEGRGRFGRLRPAPMTARIRSATSEAASESAVSPVPSDPPPTLESSGVVPPGTLERTINHHRADIRACERKRGAGSQPGGKLALRWTILPDGRAEDVRVRVSDGNIDDEALSRCVVDRVSRWRFEVPEGGPALVASTFVFQ